MNTKIIAKNLKELRGDIPRKIVARECNITVSALSNYENGIRIPRDEVKLRIADFYQKSVESIFFTSKVH